MIPTTAANLCSELGDLSDKAASLLKESQSNGDRAKRAAAIRFYRSVGSVAVKVRQMLNDIAVAPMEKALRGDMLDESEFRLLYGVGVLPDYSLRIGSHWLTPYDVYRLLWYEDTESGIKGIIDVNRVRRTKAVSEDGKMRARTGIPFSMTPVRLSKVRMSKLRPEQALFFRQFCPFVFEHFKA
jgi:hypothetical protein